MKPQNFKKDDLVFCHVAGRSFNGEYLPGFESLAIQEKHLGKVSDALMQKVLKKKWLFSLLPFVKEVAVCNTVAFGTADESSDIDLFIILDSKRFFVGRFLISFLFELFGLRRKPGKVKARFCLSFFASEECMDFSDVLIENDVYFYYWFKNLIFLKGDAKVQRSLIEANGFEVDGFRNEMGFKKFWLISLLEKLVFNWMEGIAKDVQLKRAKAKNELLGNPEGVVIKDGLLKFHVKDVRKEFRDSYLSLLLR